LPITHSSLSSSFFFSSSAAQPDLPSFPTRRSSDLHHVVDRLELPLDVALDDVEGRFRGVALRGVPAPRHVVAREGRRHGSVLRRSEEHTSELQSRGHLVCRLLLEKKKKTDTTIINR